MSKKGVINPEWELAKVVAQEMGNENETHILRIMREFKTVKKNGYTLEEAVATWRWLRAERFDEARITTVLLGSPCYIAQFKEWLRDAIPPVYEATAHDDFVMKYGRELRAIGFTYRGGRLSHINLAEAGLVDPEIIQLDFTK
jgi:hypothetical protein